MTIEAAYNSSNLRLDQSYIGQAGVKKADESSYCIHSQMILLQLCILYELQLVPRDTGHGSGTLSVVGSSGGC